MKEPLPDDIKETVEGLCHRWLELRQAGVDHGEVGELIGRAILAERRRWTKDNPATAEPETKVLAFPGRRYPSLSNPNPKGAA